jgi:putative ABC transport system substrate-binding protein
MRRRAFLGVLGGAIAARPLAAHAQQSRQMRRIGVLLGNTEGDTQAVAGLAAFKTALQELGWIVGRNIQIDYRFAAADVDRMQTLAKELVVLQPDLIMGHTTPVVAALQHETKTIPIVFIVVSDPVGNGFVASLPHPGGNITGFINIEASLSGKWIDMLIELIGTSDKSWEDAATNAVQRAAKSLRDLRVAEVVKLDMQLDEKGKVETYRAKLNVSFKFEGS